MEVLPVFEGEAVSPSIEALRTFIRASIERLEREEETEDPSTERLLFMGSEQDAIPRLLIEDPVLEPTDKVVWQVIKLKARPGAPAAFPTYRQIEASANIRSEATIARAIAILRVSRWLTLCARVRDVRGRFAGNVYVLNDEPLGLADTLYLDPDYMAFLAQAKSHHHARVRRVARAALATIEDSVRAGHDVTAPPNVIERRLEAAGTLRGEHQGGFFSFNGLRLGELGAERDRDAPERPTSNFEGGEEVTPQEPSSNFEVGRAAETSKFEVGSSSSSSSFKETTTTTTTTETPIASRDEADDALVFPALDANLKALARIYLETIPESHRQAVLDELEGRFRAAKAGAPPVYDPIRFLGKLCDAVRKGKFVENLGLSIRGKREHRRRIETRDVRREARAVSTLPPADPSHHLVRRALAIQTSVAARRQARESGAETPAEPERPHEANCDAVTIGKESEPTPASRALNVTASQSGLPHLPGDRIGRSSNPSSPPEET